MLRLAPLALAAVLLTGCDGDSLSDFDLTCEDAGFSSTGTLTASTSNGTFRANCFEVMTAATALEVRGFDIDLDVGAGLGTLRGGVELVTEGLEPGTYVVGSGDEQNARASFSPSPTSTLEAASGTVTIAEFSASRVRGSFAFETVNGATVSNGAFDIEL